MKWLVLLVAICACSNKDGPRAKGSLVFTEREAADVFLATEAEVMKSEPILRRVREERRAELAPAAITVKRRAGTMILDVTVRDADPKQAADMCNSLMRTYFDYRMSIAIEAILRQMEAVGRELERAPTNAELQRRMSELELQRASQQNDVRLLEPCLIPLRKTK